MKLLFLDIDNTLYSTAISDTPKSAVEAIRLARKNGSKVFLCTGRSLAESLSYLNYDVDGFIFASGAMVYVSKELIYDHPYPKEDIATVRNLIETHDMGVLIGGAAGAYLDEKALVYIRHYLAKGETDEAVIRNKLEHNGMFLMKDMHELDPIYKLGAWMADVKQLDDLNRDLPKPYKATITIEDDGAYFAEITNHELSKSTGIAQVLNYLHADVKDTIGIGDSANDIDMMRCCGIGIAMGNSFPEVKQAADYVTTDILEDGIWNAFKYTGVI